MRAVTRGEIGGDRRGIGHERETGPGAWRCVKPRADVGCSAASLCGIRSRRCMSPQADPARAACRQSGCEGVLPCRCERSIICSVPLRGLLSGCGLFDDDRCERQRPRRRQAHQRSLSHRPAIFRQSRYRPATVIVDVPTSQIRILSSLFGDDKHANSGGGGGGGAGVGVNSYLWRATLDTVSFMPLASADPFGGIIITDWYSPPDSPTSASRSTSSFSAASCAPTACGRACSARSATPAANGSTPRSIRRPAPISKTPS